MITPPLKPHNAKHSKTALKSWTTKFSPVGKAPLSFPSFTQATYPGSKQGSLCLTLCHPFEWQSYKVRVQPPEQLLTFKANSKITLCWTLRLTEVTFRLMFQVKGQDHSAGIDQTASMHQPSFQRAPPPLLDETFQNRVPLRSR